MYFDKLFDQWLETMPEEFLETSVCHCDGMKELDLTLNLEPLRDGSYLNELDIVKSVINQGERSEAQKL